MIKETFERVVDRKDAIIKSLAKDLEEAEEQYPNRVFVISLLCSQLCRINGWGWFHETLPLFLLNHIFLNSGIKISSFS